jgi:glycosyltransferase involved in cell wall biosynthesis
MKIANQIIQNHKNRYKTTVLKHLQNKGLSEARNTGIRAATGDYLYFLDSDDEITLNCIETLVKKSEESEVVIGGVSLPSGEIYFSNKENIFQRDEVKSAYFDSLIYDMACNKLVHKNFLLSNNLFFEPGLIHEDYLWTFFVLMACNKLKIINNMTYIYHVRENTLSTNFTIININHYIKGFNKIENYLINNLNTCRDKYKYLMNYKFLFKIYSIERVNIVFDEFKNLSFSKNKYPFFAGNFKLLCKSIFLKLPLYLQYRVVKSIINIRSFIKHII